MSIATSGFIDTPPQSRARNVTAVLGPTNTGKTHLAIERMLGHETGLIGLPLRLLAREVYDKIVERVGAANVALITGEEKIKPPSPRYHVCTVEAMPRDVAPDFLAVDEIQLAADAERGHIFTDRLFHARGQQETLLLGAATMREAIRELLPGAHLVSRPRLSTLAYAGQKKLSRLPRRTAIVAFSANDVYAIAELIRRQCGGAAVVLGALSPRTRNAQVELYQNGDVDFLVATDAIGMGLNLDVDHVAFAGLRKFDGQNHRALTSAEIGQIAGRAGRHMNDGTFGVTGTVEPFDSELIRQLEKHEFETIKLLQWRSRDLDFASLDHLRESLRATPAHRRLMRSRMVDDVIALENVSRDSDVASMAVAPAAVKTLWEVCQTPDYRKISSAAHAELVTNVYKHLLSDAGHIPEDWFANQVDFAARTDGDIDTLANRIAHIRTLTFVSHRSEWLADAAHWQERTREIEDLLSDALHERLTQRFVDRRTSVLMKRLRDKEGLTAEIGDDGAIEVERHYVGSLKGFHFTPDADAEGIHGKAARNAAARVLARELAARAERFVQAEDKVITLTRTGAIVWEGEEIARLERGDIALKPNIRLYADEHLSGPDKERILARLARWLEAHIGERLKPLVELSRADDISGLARGIAFRLTENLGVLKREAVADEIRALDQEARGQLRKYGVRFGAHNIYVPVLLKPAAADLVLLLWALHKGAEAGIDSSNLPEPPRQGLTSAETDPKLPEAYYRAAGFHLCGARVVRIDMLERLADMIRPLVGWRPTQENATPPPGTTGDGGFRVIPDMMSIVGCSGEDFATVLRSLGFRLDRRPVTPPAAPSPDQPSTTDPETAEAPQETAAPPDNFAAQDAQHQDAQHQAALAVPSTEAEPSSAAPAAQAEAEAASGGAQESASSEPAFDEIWRPRRRKQERRAKPRPAQHGKRPHEKRTQGGTGKWSGEKKRNDGKAKHGDGGPRHGAKLQQKPRRSEKKIDPDSPFAALAQLKPKLKDRASGQA